MSFHHNLFAAATVFAMVNCTNVTLAQTAGPPPSLGVIEPDQGGARGYQHSLERSRFVLGKSTSASERRTEESGFVKVIGENGVAATDQHTGFFIAIGNGGGNKDASSYTEKSEDGSVLDPDQHNEMVLNYFRSAGIPRDQIGGTHTTTYLSSSGSLNEEHPATPKIDGYASILERKVGRVPVVDSVAWARMNVKGNVLVEWVYWPAIPSKVIAEADRLLKMVSSNQYPEFLKRLPSGLPQGKVVIRHSSATATGPFEAFASYDVIDTAFNGSENNMIRKTAVVRHFDVDGSERRLPQERRNLSSTYPAKEKRPEKEQGQQ